MLDSHINNPKSPKYHVKRWLDSHSAELLGKKAVDLPAGNGVSSEILKNHGVEVYAFDLFPEYFRAKDIECRRADIMRGIPLEDKMADLAICQEGIEHFSDQLKALKEFNRILVSNGKLLITTPSYSNLSARLSYLLFESETNKQMPPNEIDDIWMVDKAVSKEIYHGHIFLIGLQKLRILAKLAGFKIIEIKYLRISKGSLFLLPFLYPLIIISSYCRYQRNMRRLKDVSKEQKKAVYLEQLKINISIRNLVNHHSFVVFEKENEIDQIEFGFGKPKVDFQSET
ncbi:MAG: class I SAM-dependent methyltransferase [Bacteroidales bacterium]|nr:class I SAM-dependent methyltransferase [Bacteroidales bacterium]